MVELPLKHPQVFEWNRGIKNVCILAATNRTEMLDAALLRPERFELILELPIPDESLRLEMLKIHTEVCLVLSVQQSEAGSVECLLLM